MYSLVLSAIGLRFTIPEPRVAVVAFLHDEPTRRSWPATAQAANSPVHRESRASLLTRVMSVFQVFGVDVTPQLLVSASVLLFLAIVVYHADGRAFLVKRRSDLHLLPGKLRQSLSFFHRRTGECSNCDSQKHSWAICLARSCAQTRYSKISTPTSSSTGSTPTRTRSCR